MKEVWKDIEGYEGLYQVSSCGRVKSLPKGDGNGYRERLLKFDVLKRNHTCYHRVTLSKNGKTERFQVHRLVAKAFIPNPENKPHINHKDFNGTNNCVENLEWVTHSENMIYSQKAGRLNEAQSIGGTKAGETSRRKMIEAIEALKGKKFGYLEVIGYIPGTGSKERNTLCKCLKCGSEYATYKELLLAGKTKMCKSCASKEMHRKHHEIREKARKKTCKKVIIHDTKTGEKKVFDSVNDAAKFVNRAVSSVTIAIKKDFLIAKRYKASFPDDDIVRSA